MVFGRAIPSHPALAYPGAMPDQPYTNTSNAAIGANAYRTWKNKAMFESTKGRVKRDTRVVPRPFV